MKLPSWLYLPIVIGGTGGLTLLLSFLFFYAFQKYSDFYVFSLILGPFFVSLPTAYAVLRRRYDSPAQRRLLASILMSFMGMTMFLSGVAVYLSSFNYNAFPELLISLPGFVLMMDGFSLAFPHEAAHGVLQNDPSRPEHLTSYLNEKSSYLPAAGVTTLIATILTSLIIFLTVPTAMDSCSSNPSTCIPVSMVILGVLSTVGSAGGIAATSTLLKGRYRRTVPLGLLLLTTSSVVSLILWNYWFMLALPIIALCAAGLALTAWNEKDSIEVSDWRAIGAVSATLGTVALVAGALQFSNDAYTCLGIVVRPYLNNAGLLLSLGAAGIIFALLIVDSARASRIKPTGFLKLTPRKIERSMFFRILIILLTLSLAATTVFTGAVLGPYLSQCRGFCYTHIEQLNIIQATPGPSSNQVTFTLTNSGTDVIRISEVQVYGGGISNPTSASQLSAPTICAGSANTLLIATFHGITFVTGTTYSFRLTSANGNSFPYTFIA